MSEKHDQAMEMISAAAKRQGKPLSESDHEAVRGSVDMQSDNEDAETIAELAAFDFGLDPRWDHNGDSARLVLASLED